MAQNDQINIIGKGITIRGSLTGGGDLVIEGRVEGQIALKNHLTIEGTRQGRGRHPRRRADHQRRGRGQHRRLDQGGHQRLGQGERRHQGAARGHRRRRGLQRLHRDGREAARRHLNTPSTCRQGTHMANTVIGSSIVIDGEISGDEDLVIQGTVKGKISAQGEPLRRGLGRGRGRHRDAERGDRRPGHRQHRRHRQGRAEEPTAAWWATSRRRASSSPTAPPSRATSTWT